MVHSIQVDLGLVFILNCSIIVCDDVLCCVLLSIAKCAVGIGLPHFAIYVSDNI